MTVDSYLEFNCPNVKNVFIVLIVFVKLRQFNFNEIGETPTRHFYDS